MVSLFNLGGGEIILLLGLLMVLVGAKWLPLLSGRLGRALLEGLFEFRKGSRQAAEDLDKEAFDTGRNLGGIYGNPAVQAITPGNQVAELYDPAVFGERPFYYQRLSNRWKAFVRMITRIVRWLLSAFQNRR